MPNLHVPPPSQCYSPQATGKHLDQGSELGALWERPEVNNLSLVETLVSQMRETGFEKKWGVDQYELATDRKYKIGNYFEIVDLARARAGGGLGVFSSNPQFLIKQCFLNHAVKHF